jgi:hypothetical protein
MIAEIECVTTGHKDIKYRGGYRIFLRLFQNLHEADKIFESTELA